MNLIANVDNQWAIGKGGKLLVRIPADMKFFRETTTGKVVVMGRKTLEGLPNGQPLKDRTNIVLTRDRNFRVRGAKICFSADELREELKKYPSEDIYMIGGESIYRQFLDECDTAYITKDDYTYSADVFFPNLDELSEWKLVESSEEQTYFDLIYHFFKYEKRV